MKKEPAKRETPLKRPLSETKSLQFTFKSTSNSLKMCIFSFSLLIQLIIAFYTKYRFFDYFYSIYSLKKITQFKKIIKLFFRVYDYMLFDKKFLKFEIIIYLWSDVNKSFSIFFYLTYSL